MRLGDSSALDIKVDIAAKSRKSHKNKLSEHVIRIGHNEQKEKSSLFEKSSKLTLKQCPSRSKKGYKLFPDSIRLRRIG
jgi:hypothetical protein